MENTAKAERIIENAKTSCNIRFEEGAKMTKTERIAEIIDIFIQLGICEPWTEEQRRELIAERERIGAEQFDQFAATAAEGVAQFIEETEAGE